MTVSATVVKLEDGPRNAVFHLYAEIGAGDSEYNVKKIDVTTLANLVNRSQACTHLSLERIQYSISYCGIKLEWEGSPNARIWTVPPQFSDHQDFRCSSPIQNNAPSRTGNVLLTTLPFAQDPALEQNDQRYDIMLWFRKKYE